MKKRILALAAVLMLAAGSLIGCGSTPAETPTTDTPVDTSDVSQITIFQSKVEITDQLMAAAAAYEAKTGIHVEVWGTTGDDFFNQLRMRLASEQGPTIFNVSPGAEVEAVAAYMADLSSLTFLDQVIDGILEEVDGKVVGIPYTLEGFGLVYNKDLYEAGDFANLDSIVAKMQRLNDAGTPALGLSSESFFLIGHILNWPFALQPDMEGFMADVIDGNVNLVDVPEFVEWANLYAAIRDYSYNPMTMNYDRQTGGLATGDIASIHQGNWSVGMFADYDIPFEIGMGPVPIAGNQKISVGVPSVWAVNADAPAAEIQAGIDFLEWLYNTPEGQSFLFDEFQFLPIIAGLDSPNVDFLSKDMLRVAGEAGTIGWATNLYPAGIVDVHLVPIAEEFFTTNMTPEALLEAIQAAFQTAGN